MNKLGGGEREDFYISFCLNLKQLLKEEEFIEDVEGKQSFLFLNLESLAQPVVF